MSFELWASEKYVVTFHVLAHIQGVKPYGKLSFFKEKQKIMQILRPSKELKLDAIAVIVNHETYLTVH